ncbi:DNA-binding response regulator [Sphaerisporangium album]|uniref:DNA-binding response regulator n=1 Tax=Sphaerisporangium album TaxID=509200 RepID=A0A367FQF0_9ACTN|nr:response regulator transcription factor [Sphaerisporangium album]RCG32139.1 DNA-binding response regulator [Sphaerisporangium album]
MHYRVLICDETTLVRDGLRTLLDAESDITVVDTTDSGQRAIMLVRSYRPHVVVTGLTLQGMLGIELIRRLLREDLDPVPRVVVFATNEHDDTLTHDTLTNVLHAGASGLLTRETSRDDLVAAIRTVASGQAMLTPRMTQRLLDWFRQHKTEPDDMLQPYAAALTEREREVLLLTARGMSTEDIGVTLSISVATVRTHIYRLRNKLQLRDRAQLVSFAYRAGMMQAEFDLANN